MRLQGQAKLGYYPTPATQTALILSWLKTATASESERLRLFDPCCGEGEALNQVASHLKNATRGIETYGIELSTSRAEKAGTTLDQVLNTGFENAILTKETFSMIWLNPPYDGETMTGGGTRQELTFLQTATPVLVRGGTLVYILPEGRVSDEVARHLAGWYQDLRVFRFEPVEYETFGQIVVLGQRRFTYSQPSVQAKEAITAWASGKRVTGYATRSEAGENGTVRDVDVPVTAPLPTLTSGSGDYVIPAAPLRNAAGQGFRFKYVPVSEDDYWNAGLKTAAQVGQSAEWRSLIPKLETERLTPVMKPKTGHISMLVVGGLLGTSLVTEAETGDPLLIKGGTETYWVRTDTEDEVEELEWADSDGKKKRLFRVNLEQRARPILTTLTHRGDMQTHRDPQAISRILEGHVRQLADMLEASNLPLYDGDARPWELSVFPQLSQGRSLPGMPPGFSPRQRDFAIGVARLLRKSGSAFMNIEMGGGKTGMALAVNEVLDTVHRDASAGGSSYPGLVVGPGIVTGEENWPREVRDVVPGAASRVLEAAANPLPKPARLAEWLKTKGVQLDEAAFTGLSPNQAFNEVLRCASKGGVYLLIRERTALQLALRRGVLEPPQRRPNAAAPNLLDVRIGGYAWLSLSGSPSGEEDCLPRDLNHAERVQQRYSLVRFIQEYQCGALPRKSYAVLSFETAKLDAGRVPAMATRKRIVRDANGGAETMDVCVCPTCGHPVAFEYDDEGNPFSHKLVRPGEQAREFVGARRRYCMAPASKWVWREDEGIHVLSNSDSRGNPLACGTPLFQLTGLRRVAASRYIQRKARRFFKFMALDEIHETKAKGTGNGEALTLLANSVRYTLGLTGTLFGGYSTSVFWLLYRMSGSIRNEFSFHGEREWVRKFGLERQTFYVTDRNAVGEDGSYTGTKYLTRTDERPGIRPSIIRVGLPQIAFGSLQDMGLPLPPYSEEIVWLDLSPQMREQYDRLADGSFVDRRNPPPSSLYAWALRRMKDGDKGALAVWLATALNRLDTMHLPETVTYQRAVDGKGRGRRRKTVSEEVLFLPSIPETAPKEEWLVERCLAERRDGRKTIVFVRQSGKRDVLSRLAGLLEEQGLRVGVLRASIAPRQRMAWIQKNQAKMDVLICNSRLVKVGLNLRMFQTAVFYEIEWSLYILWQAMRRLYRPGAKEPVKVVFPAYRHTLEEHALNLIGEKMKAASLFYGDEVSSALTEEDESDFLRSLVQDILTDKKSSVVEQIFGIPQTRSLETVMLEDSSPPPSLPVAVNWEQWLGRQNHESQAVQRTRRKREAIPVQQSSMF